jgi:hypothetical protein
VYLGNCNSPLSKYMEYWSIFNGFLLYHSNSLFNSFLKTVVHSLCDESSNNILYLLHFFLFYVHHFYIYILHFYVCKQQSIKTLNFAKICGSRKKILIICARALRDKASVKSSQYHLRNVRGFATEAYFSV